MGTYLSICDDVARESGTVPGSGTLISTVIGQTGRKARIVNWVADAYTRMQSSRPDWRWLQGEFSGPTVANTRRYNSGAMLITDRFAEWGLFGEDPTEYFSVYLTSDGQAQERFLPYLPWHEFYRLAIVGPGALGTGDPQSISIDPQDNLAIYPLPDAIYTVSGRYQKSPQLLTTGTQIPAIAPRYHDAIKYRALMMLAEFDEAQLQYQLWEKGFDRIMDQLIDVETPVITRGPPLA